MENKNNRHSESSYYRYFLTNKFVVENFLLNWIFFAVFCYSARGDSEGCNAKDGNPFGPFWDTFGVDFDESIFYRPLHYDVYFGDTTQQWMERWVGISS